MPEMTQEEAQSKIRSLERQFRGLLDDVNLTRISRAASDLTNEINGLPGDIADLRQRGYAFRSYLEHKAEVLAKQWDAIRNQVMTTIQEDSRLLREELDRVEPDLKNLLAQPDQRDFQQKYIPMLESTFESIETKAKAIANRLEDMYRTIKSDVAETRKQIKDINWFLDMKDEASFDFNATEAVFLVAEAEWTDGKGKPDGMLFLTDQRIIFEQREKKGKALGLFGGKDEQGVLWEAHLHQIDGVEAENKGVFGGKDMLNFTFGSGASFANTTAEVKGGVDCKFWAAQIRRMRTGEVADERAIEPDTEVIESLRNAPTACPVCAGTLPQVTAGQTEITCQYCGWVMRL